MNLLRYEFIDVPDDSFNGRLRKLVKDIRYNSTKVNIDEFQLTLPTLRKIEEKLQQFDAEIGQPHKNYIEEIMQELSLESENEANFATDLSAMIKAMSKKYFDEHFNSD